MGGDWYDVIPYEDGRLALVVGDVAGRGVEAARLMTQVRSAVHIQSLEEMSPGEVLARANDYMRRHFPDRIVTAAFAVWDPIRSEATVASAGHLPPIFVDADGRASFVSGRICAPLGGASVTDYEERTLAVQRGAMLILYTDGLVDNRVESLRSQLDDLCTEVEEVAGEPEDVCDRLLESREAREPRQGDDIAVLAVKSVGSPDRELRMEFEARTDAIRSARRQLERWLDHKGVESRAAHHLLMAVGEACTNAMEHPYGLGEARVQVRARIVGEVTEVKVRDFGRWRDSGPHRGRGRGLGLIDKLVTEHEILTNDSGTTVILRQKALPPLHAGEGG